MVAAEVINYNHGVRKCNYNRTSRRQKAIRRCLRRRAWNGPHRRTLVDAADPRVTAWTPPLRRPQNEPEWNKCQCFDAAPGGIGGSWRARPAPTAAASI